MLYESVFVFSGQLSPNWQMINLTTNRTNKKTGKNFKKRKLGIETLAYKIKKNLKVITL